MKSTRVFSVSLVLFSLLVLVGFVHLSFQRAEQAEEQRLTQETRRRLEEDLETVRRERNPAVLMTFDLARFIQGVRDESAAIAARDPSSLDDRRLARLFHDLRSRPTFRTLRAIPGEMAICRVATTASEPGRIALKSRAIYRSGSRFGLTPLAPRLSLLFDQPFSLLQRSGKVREELRKVLPIPTLILELYISANERFRISRNGDTVRGFLWASIPIPGSPDRLFLCMVTDITRLDEAFSSRYFARSRGSDDFGIAFLPRHPGHRRIATPRWNTVTPWRPPKTGTLRRDPPPTLRQQGRWIMRGERLSPDHEYDVSLVRRIPLSEGGKLPALRVALPGLMVCLILFALIEISFFGRGLILTFSLRMGGAFLLACLLPLAGTLFLGFETFRQGRQSGEFSARRALRQSLEGLEYGFRDHAARAQQSILWHISRPEFKKALIRAENIYRATGSTASAAEVMKRLQDDLKHPPSLNDGSAVLTPVETMTILTSGPRKLFAAVHYFQQSSYEHFRTFYNTLGNIWLRAHNPSFNREQDEERTSNGLKQGILDEYSVDSLTSFYGTKSFLEFVFHADRLFIMTQGMAQLYFSICGIDWKGLTRFFLMVHLRVELFERAYFKSLLRKTRAPDEPLLYYVDQSNKVSFPEDIASWPALTEARTRLTDTGFAYSGRDASGTLLIEGVPGRQVARAAFIGAIPADPIDREMIRRRWLFAAGVLFSLLLALVLSASASIIFIRPIRTLTAAVERVAQGDYRGGIDLRGGPAEFAALGQTFNTMCNDLQAGKVLGSFVSEGVRRAASEGNLDLLAGEAQESQITVMFCGIAGFKTLSRTESAPSLVEMLDRHLSRVSTLASGLGGEIDKMVGDKVMVVFDHARFADGEAAVAAALSLARQLAGDASNTEFHPSGGPEDDRSVGGISGAPRLLPLAIGINSGPALSGILGSPAFRLDYTVIGDTVNLAARLAELANHQEAGGIILSGQTLVLAPPDMLATRLDIDSVRGKTREVQAYALD